MIQNYHFGDAFDLPGFVLIFSEDEFKPKKGEDNDDSEESSGDDSESLSEPTESEVDSPVKVKYNWGGFSISRPPL